MLKALTAKYALLFNNQVDNIDFFTLWSFKALFSEHVLNESNYVSCDYNRQLLLLECGRKNRWM